MPSDPPTVHRTLGQQWCRPNGRWSSSDSYGRECLYPGNVAVLTDSHGWLILCDVVQDVETGKVSFVPVKLDDLPVME